MKRAAILVLAALTSSSEAIRTDDPAVLRNTISGDLIEERSTGIPHTKEWKHEAKTMKTWHVRTHEQLQMKIFDTCDEEYSSLESWMKDASTSFQTQSDIDAMRSSVESNVSSATTTAEEKTRRLRGMIGTLNKHIERVNRIFSAAHLIAMQDLVANIIMLRQTSLSLRSTEKYRDPAFDPIKTYEIPRDVDVPIPSTMIELGEKDMTKTDSRMDEVVSMLNDFEKYSKEGEGRRYVALYGSRIREDVAAWKRMKINFEAERNALTSTRELLETLLATKKKTLEMTSLASKRTLRSEVDQSRSAVNVLPFLQQHRDLIGNVCDGTEHSVNEGATSDSCADCLARQAKGENIACSMCDDEGSCANCLARQANGENIACSMCGGDEGCADCEKEVDELKEDLAELRKKVSSLREDIDGDDFDAVTGGADDIFEDDVTAVGSVSELENEGVDEIVLPLDESTATASAGDAPLDESTAIDEFTATASAGDAPIVPGCDGEPPSDSNGCDDCEFAYVLPVERHPITDKPLRSASTTGICTGCMLADDGVAIVAPNEPNSNFDEMSSLGDITWCPSRRLEMEVEDAEEDVSGTAGEMDIDLDGMNDDEIFDMLDDLSISMIETAQSLRGRVS